MSGDSNLLHLNTDTAKDIQLYLTSRGLLHLSEDPDEPPYHTSIAAVPTPINYEHYLAVKTLLPDINCVLDKMSRDKDFITSNLTELAAYDPFCKGFLDIYTSLPDRTPDQITLGMFRHDFMYSTAEPRSPASVHSGHFNLVEFNLVSASMGPLAEGVHKYHQTLVLRAFQSRDEKCVAEVNIVRGFCEGLCRAHDMYKRKHNTSSCVVVLVLEKYYDFLSYDKQLLLNALEEEGVPTARYTTKYLLENGRVDKGRYYVDDREVAVFYFRTMFDPRHFPSPEYWNLRREMEHSAAFTVPTVPHQIVNMKFFQMLLSKQEVLERYTDPGTAAKLMKLFCETLPLALDDEGNRNAQLALDNPDNYVLKPQREGGGNNHWGSEMVKKLKELGKDPARCTFILMRKITPPIFPNKFFKKGAMSEEVDTVSELGFCAVYYTEGDKVLVNKVVGPLIRTKCVGDNEGGVCVGIASIGSPYFV